MWEWENKTRDLLPAIKKFIVGLRLQLTRDEQATKSSLVQVAEDSTCSTAKNISSLSFLVWA